MDLIMQIESTIFYYFYLITSSFITVIWPIYMSVDLNTLMPPAKITAIKLGSDTANTS